MYYISSAGDFKTPQHKQLADTVLAELSKHDIVCDVLGGGSKVLLGLLKAALGLAALFPSNARGV